ncbi:cation:proton antiporter [Streptomyces neyagawaensis]|uniref:cation:proton antiporter n=1 Tax=Streptomyces neyagawaensis TaxID=42238 RepID=UPI0007C6E7F7|nr:cation:proton antiporter [Streptomyces neyagawaensis]MCL6737139.1 cation:proton antiporter [Streptomyces neyagawaensis]MDE1688526.1 cation:proton antiporter [Streptomyces neyagawaensis]
MTNHQLTTLFLALALISLLAFGAGALARRLRQPPVIGEVLLGVLLGPTLLGEAVSGTLFPDDVRPFLAALANLGVALFMFTVGAELDTGLLRGHRAVAGAVAAGSVVLPFGLGALLALHLFDSHPTADRTGFVLFMGAAMSVTAFPVLARILTDRGIRHTWLGAVALACAAIDDVLAWTLLAAVVAIAGAATGSHWLLLLFVPYALLMFTAVGPALRRFLAGRWAADRGRSASTVVTLAGLLASAAFTEWIGLHFIFGAFLFGAIMPRRAARDTGDTRDMGDGRPDAAAQVPASPGRISERVTERVSHLNDLLLLPVFFVVAGLKVDLSGMDGGDLTELALILVVAVSGKFIGAFGAARATGLPGRPAAALAVLVNTRGLTELVILTVGLQLGALDDRLYSSMVVMALVTTAMAGPLLHLILPTRPAAQDLPDTAAPYPISTTRAQSGGESGT